MNLNFVAKLCNMIQSSYQVFVTFFDTDGTIVYKPDILNDDYINYFLNESKHIVRQCLNKKEIQISINEIAITWIGIPVICEELIKGSLMIGPFYCNRMSDKTLLEELEKMEMDEAEKLLYMRYRNIFPCYSYEDYFRIISLVYYYLNDKNVDEKSIQIIGKTVLYNPSLNGEESDIGIPELEEHGSYQYEKYLWECIRMGEVDKVHELSQSNIHFKMGTLSLVSEIRNMKNLHIVGIALASRAAMEGGLNPEIAYSLSDLFIRQIESSNRIQADEITSNAFYEFARRVKELSKIRSYSPNVNQCCEYIKTHANENLSVSQIADYLGISHTYLSRIFKQETGISVVDYIKKVKVKEAKFLLKYTDFSLVEISQKLSYSSQSHFNTVFKEEMSITPKQYRDKVKVYS